jgi:hypothetical protein
MNLYKKKKQIKTYSEKVSTVHITETNEHRVLQLTGEQFQDLCQCANQVQVAAQKMYDRFLYYRREPADVKRMLEVTLQISWIYSMLQYQ